MTGLDLTHKCSTCNSVIKTQDIPATNASNRASIALRRSAKAVPACRRLSPPVSFLCTCTCSVLLWTPSCILSITTCRWVCITTFDHEEEIVAVLFRLRKARRSDWCEGSLDPESNEQPSAWCSPRTSHFWRTSLKSWLSSWWVWLLKEEQRHSETSRTSGLSSTVLGCMHKALLARKQMLRNYKHHIIIKFLVACSAQPLGSITFVSRAWGARANDKKITCDECLDLPSSGEVQ